MMKDATDAWGGKETIAVKIAETIRKIDPTHKIALTRTPEETLAVLRRTQLEELLALFSAGEVAISEILGEPQVSNEEMIAFLKSKGYRLGEPGDSAEKPLIV